MSSMHIDVHVLQTVPPSNLNRDDTGSPKTAVYGGVRRARVSSQAWKRATRLHFQDQFDQGRFGVRSRGVVSLIADAIEVKAPGIAEGAAENAAAVIRALGLKLEPARKSKKAKDDEPVANEALKSDYLLYFSGHQIERMANLAIECANSGTPVTKAAALAAATKDHGVDVALFGRMVADSTELKVDAAAQVAHALSVHGVETEYDYFTAVDDHAADDHAGASMIGTVEFNSATLYRYATVNVDALRHTLGDQEVTIAAVEQFVRSFVMSMPTGKQNTFANRTVPDAVVVLVREGQPVNLVGAFENAVVATASQDRLAMAAQRLVDHSRRIDEVYELGAGASFVLAGGASVESLSVLGTSVTLSELMTAVGGAVRGRVGQSA